MRTFLDDQHVTQRVLHVRVVRGLHRCIGAQLHLVARERLLRGQLGLGLLLLLPLLHLAPRLVRDALRLGALGRVLALQRQRCVGVLERQQLLLARRLPSAARVRVPELRANFLE